MRDWQMHSSSNWKRICPVRQNGGKHGENKVHELAKELELQSKDILSFLQEKGIEAKAAQSSLEEDAAALVRNSLGKKKAAAPAAQKAPVNTENAKPAEEKAQAPAGEAKGSGNESFRGDQIY